MSQGDIISIHGSHNAAIAFGRPTSPVIQVVEIERLLGYKNAGLAQYKTVPSADEIVQQAVRLGELLGYGPTFDLCTSTNIDVIHGRPNGVWEKVFHNRTIQANKKVFGPTHHLCHACGTFYQSPFEKAVIVSFDGGGDDGFFDIFMAENRIDGPKQVVSHRMDLGFAYMVFGAYIDAIRFEPSLSDGNLIYSGKLMGLCGYGKAVEKWVEPMMRFYRAKPDGNNYETLIKTLSDEIGITLSWQPEKRLKGQAAYDLAATSQRVFEELFFELAAPTINSRSDLPICVTGGCALNVLLNTRIKMTWPDRTVFVAPNSSDCGIAVGNLLYHLRPKTSANIIYAGLPLLDLESVAHHWYPISSQVSWERLDDGKLVDLLAVGKIIGVARGFSEHGPRALGNRSILCDPAFPQMKDVLNSKVKHREWYRPFAPVVRTEEANAYFEVLEESPYMSFAFKVRDEWQTKLSSVTHVDGTARVQTLRRDDNPWLYGLLGKFRAKTGHGVLLNTSFNVNGQPILSTVKEAFQILTTTQLDGILIQDNLFLKK
jgi:carbamoyltransferase